MTPTTRNNEWFSVVVACICTGLFELEGMADGNRDCWSCHLSNVLIVIFVFGVKLISNWYVYEQILPIFPHSSSVWTLARVNGSLHNFQLLVICARSVYSFSSVGDKHSTQRCFIVGGLLGNLCCVMNQTIAICGHGLIQSGFRHLMTIALFDWLKFQNRFDFSIFICQITVLSDHKKTIPAAVRVICLQISLHLRTFQLRTEKYLLFRILLAKEIISIIIHEKIK